MSELAASITGYVAGDDLEVRRTITDPNGDGLPDPIAVAWLTIKLYAGQPDLEAVLQKRITATDAPGTGQIVAAGGGGNPGDLRFDLTADDTEKLGDKEYVFDIQIMLETDAVFTVELGTFQLVAGVTKATT